MDHRIRLKVFDYGGEKIVFGYVAHEQLNGFTGKILPDPKPVAQRLDGCESLNAQLKIPLPAEEIVDNRNIMTGFRKM
jgi:hypothetical protein